MNLPLAGVRLLDLSRVLAGPFCSQLLGDLGATVIKIERPGCGDETRQWGPPFPHGQSAYFQSVNRNKLSLALDLKHPRGLAVLDGLIRACDLLLENFLPDESARFGLHPERLRQLNPRLVSCSISGFGRDGPWRHRPGYDAAIQAVSGLMAVTGPEAGEPCKVGVAVTDVIAGLFAAVSLLAGLVARRAADFPAETCSADVALLDATLAALVNVAQAALATGKPPPRHGNAHPTIVPYQTFAASDGAILVAVGNDAQFRRLAALVDRPEWADDDRFATNPQRVAHRRILVPLLEERFLLRSVGEWCAALEAAEIPHGPVLDLRQALALPPVAERGVVAECVTPAGQRLDLIRSPIRWNGAPLPVRSPPPELGADGAHVLRTLLGYTDEQIDELRASGVLGTPA